MRRERRTARAGEKRGGCVGRIGMVSANGADPIRSGLAMDGLSGVKK